MGAGHPLSGFDEAHQTERRCGESHASFGGHI